MLETVEIETQANPQYAIIWLHGLGADGYDFEPVVPELNISNVRFVFPHAPIQPVTINAGMHMRAWYDIFELGSLDQQDEDGIEKSQALVHDLIQAQNNRGIKTEHIFLVGFSQGGALALHTGLRYPQALAGIVGLSTYLPLHYQLEQKRHVANQQTPILIMHGTLDPVITVLASELCSSSLKALEYAVEYKAYVMAHQLCTQQIADLRTWFLGRMG